MECTLPQTYTDIQALLGLVGDYRRFIKGFACIVQSLNEYLSGDGAGKMSELVTLTKEALHTFKMLKKVCITTPMLAFIDFERSFLLETDASKEGLEAALFLETSRWLLPPSGLWLMAFSLSKQLIVGYS